MVFLPPPGRCMDLARLSRYGARHPLLVHLGLPLHSLNLLLPGASQVQEREVEVVVAREAGPEAELAA